MTTKKPIRTAAQINSLTPESKKYRRAVTNKSNGGLAVIVLPSGRKQYVFRYRRPSDRKEREIVLPVSSLSAARAKHDKCHDWLKESKDPAIELQNEKRETAEALTMQQLFDEWITYYASTPNKKTKRPPTDKTVRKQRQRWQLHLKRLAPIPARDIEKGPIVKQLDTIREKSAEEARQCLSILRMMLSYAEHRGHVDTNHAQFIEAAKIGLYAADKRKRHLSLAELRQVWKATDTLSPSISAAFKLLILTGCRRGEIAGLQRKELDTDSNTLTISGERTKNRKPHTVHLHPLAVDIIDNMKELTEQSGYILESQRKAEHPIHPDSITTALERLRGIKRNSKGKGHTKDDKAPLAALEAFTVHDIRRSARTAWGQHCKILPHVAELMLNHLPSQLEQTYDLGTYDDEKREGWTIWGDLVAAVIAQDAGNITPISGRTAVQ